MAIINPFDRLIMNAFLLFNDIRDILRLRYRPIHQYRYPLAVWLLGIFALGAIDATQLSLITGATTATFIFGTIIAFLQIVLLSRVMTKVCQYFGSERLPFLGYCFLTQLLNLPALISLYIPQTILFFFLWKCYIIYIQILGFKRASQQNIWKIILGYLISFILLMFIINIILSLFIGAQWFDYNQIQENIQSLTQEILTNTAQ